MSAETDPGALCATYLEQVQTLLTRILREEGNALGRAASMVAEQVASDRLVSVYGPGGHLLVTPSAPVYNCALV